MIALALMAIGQPAPDGAAIDGPPLAWSMDHAPYGADITLDGKVWINTNKGRRRLAPVRPGSSYLASNPVS